MSAFAAAPHSALAEVNEGGKFVRTASGFRDVTGVSAIISTFRWLAHGRTGALSVLNLKGLQEHIGVTVVHPTWGRTRPDIDADSHCGWIFHDSSKGQPVSSSTGHGAFVIAGCTPDPLGHKCVRDLYEASGDSLKKYTVPVLWDTQTSRIVNNESSEIIRMLNSAFNAVARNPTLDLYPPALQAGIDAVNAMVYESINDGVYKCGFAKIQAAYEAAVDALYAGLDQVEATLSRQRYLVGSDLTEADVRLFMTLVRFDEVYVVYFKCNKRRIADYPNLLNYCRDLYQTEGIGSSIDMAHIMTHYFSSHPTLNPYAIVPSGPGVEADLAKPHDRNRF